MNKVDYQFLKAFIKTLELKPLKKEMVFHHNEKTYRVIERHGRELIFLKGRRIPSLGIPSTVAPAFTWTAWVLPNGNYFLEYREPGYVKASIEYQNKNAVKVKEYYEEYL